LTSSGLIATFPTVLEGHHISFYQNMQRGVFLNELDKCMERLRLFYVRIAVKLLNVVLATLPVTYCLTPEA